MKQTPTTRSFLGEGDLTLSWSIGPTRFFLCWNSSVLRINDEITESRGNLEQWPNTTSSPEVSKKVAGDAEGGNGEWKIKLIMFVGATSGSLQVQTLNDNLKELQVIESKGNAIRKALVYELLNAKDTVLC